MLTEYAHLMSWLVYYFGVVMGFFVLKHLLINMPRSFTKYLLLGLYWGVLLAPVATNGDKFFFTPAIMQLAMSLLSSNPEDAAQAAMSLSGVTVLALLITSAYYLLIVRKHHSA